MLDVVLDVGWPMAFVGRPGAVLKLAEIFPVGTGLVIVDEDTSSVKVDKLSLLSVAVVSELLVIVGIDIEAAELVIILDEVVGDF